MIKHVVVFNFDFPTEADEAAALGAMRGLLGVVPELKSATVGRNISPRDATYTHCLVTEFDDMDAMMRYVVHPAHEAVLQDHVKPFCKHRAILDYEI